MSTPAERQFLISELRDSNERLRARAEKAEAERDALITGKEFWQDNPPSQHAPPMTTVDEAGNVWRVERSDTVESVHSYRHPHQPPYATESTHLYRLIPIEGVTP